ncbi:MAG TPA: A/G-specific adenine glycosylase [Cyclobacteriaceae bacterium]|nr:A/G-specific adenine glycosylase [Cyclobacteriaceae bacterium]HRK54871.1 A/G-specific adenine glycosylase [Cyclobacteriaceae bacterium]
MAKKDFSKKIVDWYLVNPRDLPWRKTKDPYRIWLSEVILQQTRVAQGLPYYLEFVRNFPNVKALANASEDKVMRTWQGLGYYSRARNLHACAKVIAHHYNGQFPKTHAELLALPGIGEYTAAAIGSMAFDQPEAVVDGNVFRVLSRVFGIEEDVSTATGKKVFALKAKELLDIDQPGVHNQAVMEFGALHCTPTSPNCTTCIFSTGCFAKRQEMQNVLPVKSKKVKIRTRHFTYFVITKGNKLAMRKREGKDIWSGLYDFYLIEGKRAQHLKTLMKKDSALAQIEPYINIEFKSDSYKHVLTHQHLLASFVMLSLSPGLSAKKLLDTLGIKFYSLVEVASLPKPVLVSRFLTKEGILE